MYYFPYNFLFKGGNFFFRLPSVSVSGSLSLGRVYLISKYSGEASDKALVMFKHVARCLNSLAFKKHIWQFSPLSIALFCFGNHQMTGINILVYDDIGFLTLSQMVFARQNNPPALI